MGMVFYGTQTGNTVGVAEKIQDALADLIGEIKCIQDVKAADFDSCDFFVLGGSTWGDGELTDDWQDFFPQLDRIDFTGKRVALFGLGDQVSYSYNFVSSMKLLYDKLQERGAQVIVSEVSTDGFTYDHSEAVVGGHFLGLVIDEMNEPELTDERIAGWASAVRSALVNSVSLARA